MSEQPDYPNYTVEQLLEAKERIDAERFPENARRLEAELARRHTSQPSPQVLQPDSSSPEPQLMGCIVVVVAFMLVTGGLFFFLFSRSYDAVTSFAESPSYRQAVAQTEGWEQFADRIGSPATTELLGLEVTESITTNGSRTNSSFGILFTGPKGEARLEAVATARGESVTFQRLHLWHGAEGFDLLQLP